MFPQCDLKKAKSERDCMLEYVVVIMLCLALIPFLFTACANVDNAVLLHQDVYTPGKHL
jgi:hypothetical protein